MVDQWLLALLVLWQGWDLDVDGSCVANSAYGGPCVPDLCVAHELGVRNVVNEQISCSPGYDPLVLGLIGTELVAFVLRWCP